LLLEVEKNHVKFKYKSSKETTFENGLAQEVHDVYMLREPHGLLEQVHWSAGKADLT
jgi:hypothetical protein